MSVLFVRIKTISKDTNIRKFGNSKAPSDIKKDTSFWMECSICQETVK